MQTLQREPTPSEIAEKAGLDTGYVTRWLAVLSAVVELDKPVPAYIERDDLDVYNLVDGGLESPEEAAERRDSYREVIQAIQSLPPGNERVVLTLHYLASPPESLRAIGRRIGVSPERVRQIESAALARLRGMLHSVKLS